MNEYVFCFFLWCWVKVCPLPFCTKKIVSLEFPKSNFLSYNYPRFRLFLKGLANCNYNQDSIPKHNSQKNTTIIRSLMQIMLKVLF